MSRRSWFRANVETTSPGLVIGVISWITTNIATNPDNTLFRGAGGLSGADATGGSSNSSPTFVSSITKTANNGEFLVTLKDGYRAIWFSRASLGFTAAGPADGFDACVGNANNEGSGHETPLTFLVTTVNATGVPVETAGRRVSVLLVLKNSGVGA